MNTTMNTVNQTFNWSRFTAALRKEIAALNVELAKENVTLTITRDNSRPIAAQVSEYALSLDKSKG